ncbi:MAG: hypothetical protein N3F64_00835 [Nitrososphaeria archaeon]|nr:hypothetical protein [Nitrososphaeria archaeon]
MTKTFKELYTIILMLDLEKVQEYYLRDFVVDEIFEYCRNRWVALEIKSSKERIFFRYLWRNGPPLSFSKKDFLKNFIRKYSKLYPRTFYASVNVYRSLVKRDDVEKLDNIFKATPVWDIDGSLSNIKLTLEAANIIVDELGKYGLRESVYLKWSGRGLHVHVNENAFSEELLKKYHPLDIAYSTVEYVLKRVWNKISALSKESTSLERPFKVENKIDIQRVFTTPLSLHRELDLVAVCFKPNSINNFDLEWCNPQSPKHDSSWKNYVIGEGDQLALKAIAEVGGYFQKYKEKITEISSKPKSIEAVKTPIVSEKIGRFQVMALLQAARYYLLKGDLDRAKSFGLNRAIFYAWAKHSKPIHYRAKATSITKYVLEKKALKFEKIGDEEAPVTEDGWFTIGDTIQLPKDFDHQIVQKIKPIVSFEIAWDTALNYLKSFPKNVLESQREFFEKAYKPVRDTFINLIKDFKSNKLKENIQ